MTNRRLKIYMTVFVAVLAAVGMFDVAIGLRPGTGFLVGACSAYLAVKLADYIIWKVGA